MTFEQIINIAALVEQSPELAKAESARHGIPWLEIMHLVGASYEPDFLERWPKAG